jgi:hypothetical protein
MPRTHEDVFLDELDRSSLSEETKTRFRYHIASRGVDPALWSAFNDALIDQITRSEKARAESADRLDGEIDRFTAAYENEKSVIDAEFRDRLRAALSDEAETEILWREYAERVRRLQAKMLSEVEASSTSVLHDVVLATVPLAGNE